MQFSVGGEKLCSFVNGHSENIADGLAIVSYCKSCRIIAFAVATLAMSPRGGEKVHFQLNSPVPFTLRALATRIVEGKSGGIESLHARLRKLSEEFANFIEDLHVSRGAGSRGFTNGRLIDLVAMAD